MSVIPAIAHPSLSLHIPSANTRSSPTPSTPIQIPEVVVNGKKYDPKSLQHARPSKLSMASNVSPVGDGWGSHFWVTLVDPQTHTAFYACPATGQVSWDPPVGNFVLPPSEEGEWWELADDSRGGLPYYYHTKTGETVWERPEAFVIPLGILQNTSLARRLSARFSIGAQLDGDFPTNDKVKYAKPCSHTTDSGDPTSSTRLDGKLRSQSSTRSSPGRITPSASSPGFPSSKSQIVVPRRSFSNDQYHNASKRGSHLPTIPGSDVSDGPTPRSPIRKSPSSLNTRNNKKDSPPRTNGTSSTSSAHSSLSRARSKAYSTHRSPQPQSLNAAVELLSTPIETTFPLNDTGVPRPSLSADNHGPTKKTVTISPPSPQKPIPTAPRTPTRNVSYPIVSLRGKGISVPVIDSEATKNMSPVKTGNGGKPILVQRPSDQSRAYQSTGALPVLPQDLASDIQQFSESDFARQYFSTHRTGFIFRRTVPVAQLMSWQKSPLSSPLLVLNRSLHKNAVKIFKVIQRLMGDREREKTGNATRNGTGDSLSLSPIPSRTGAVSPLIGSISNILGEERWLLSEALTHGELRDEIYCQIMKQLSGNPSSESIFKGWQLLCVCLVSFPPSKNFETYLRSFIQQRTTQPEGRVDVMAKYCLRRLTFISKKGPRGKPPTAWEIEMASDAAFNPSIFGESLDVIYRLQQRIYPQQKVPIILPFLADGILALGGTKSEGIFRIPGDGDGVSELKLRINKGHYNLEGMEDPYILASLMKLWLRELCDPLVPEEMYNDCITASKAPEACIELVQRLPTVNRRVVLFVISFLQLFLDEKVQSVTKMTSANLALVMAPNLLRCNSDSMAVVFNNAEFEQMFVNNLLQYLKCNELDKDYVPTHGLGAVLAPPSAQPRPSKSRNRRPA